MSDVGVTLESFEQDTAANRFYRGAGWSVGEPYVDAASGAQKVVFRKRVPRSVDPAQR